MPPSDYLTASAIERSLHYMAGTYPSICQLILMPEKSVERRNIRAIKLGKGTGANRRGVLFLGGVHARELVNPDLLVSLALKLCQSYTAGTGLTFGGKSFESSTIKLLIDAMDIFFLPLVNPDGRAFVQSPSGDAMWRKNRNPNPTLPCKGVDLNRNFDFLHSSGIGTSSNSCSEIFKGSGAFSEPETRNVRHMLDAFPSILGMVDVHSYSELILHPWGDDNNQTTDPTMNFQNPAFDGLRGNPGDNLYREFIPQSDLDSFVKIGFRIRDAIAAVRGRVYTAEQAVLLYPTTGTSKDYGYSRNFVDATKRKVFSYTIETGREFQPPYGEALNIISEVSAGLIEFCMACLCVVEETLAATALSAELDDMRDFRDKEMLDTSAGRKYVELLENIGIELMLIMADDEKLRKETIELVGTVTEVMKSRKTSKPKVLSANITSAAEKLLQSFASKGSVDLVRAIKEVRQDLKHFRGKTVLGGLESVSKIHSDKKD
jgi:murein tripeptide amidase MpaA